MSNQCYEIMLMREQMDADPTAVELCETRDKQRALAVIERMLDSGISFGPAAWVQVRLLPGGQ